MFIFKPKFDPIDIFINVTAIPPKSTPKAEVKSFFLLAFSNL